MTSKLPLILAFLTITPIFSTETVLLDREDGSKLSVYMDHPELKSYPITLILPGPQKETSQRVHTSLKADLLKIGHGAVTLEKRGVSVESIDEKEFNQTLSLDERLRDYLLLIKNLGKLLPDWNGKLALIGQGDGGRIGAKLAGQTENVLALVLIASGGGWAPMEESLHSFRTEMADQGYSPQYIHGFLVQARQEFSQALKSPKPDLKAFGYTYKYWNSLFNTKLIEDLAKLDCPIYTINGVNDDRVPIESVEAMAKHLKDKVTLSKKENAGREILLDHEIYEEAISWLELSLQD
jgi:pimeloyl-ACP methyl ester carboxylesterase